MPDTLTIQQRFEASNVIQRALAEDPLPEAGKQYWLGMDREEAISMIGTLRGHDTLDLSDKVRDALEQTGGELSLVVTDVFRRMDADEYDEFICHLTAAINHEAPVDLDELLGQAIAEGLEIARRVGGNQVPQPAEASAEAGSFGVAADGVPQFGIGEFDHYPTRAEIEERLERLFPGFAERFAGDIHVRRQEPAADILAGRDPGDEDPKPVRAPHRTILRMTPHGVVEVTGAERDEVLDALGVG